MRLKFTLAVLALLSLPLGVSAQIILSTTYVAGQPPVVVSGSGSSNLTTNSNTVIVSSGATVTYHNSGSYAIMLEPGFHASAGSKFYAMIASTVDSDSNGLPDVWERANGLTVGTINAGSTAPNGLTYLVSYLLGVIPNPAVAKQDDGGNSTQLKINRPTQ